MFLRLQFEAFYTVNLLNAKWRVVPARNSGWKKRVPLILPCYHYVFPHVFVFFNSSILRLSMPLAVIASNVPKVRFPL